MPSSPSGPTRPGSSILSTPLVAKRKPGRPRKHSVAEDTSLSVENCDATQFGCDDLLSMVSMVSAVNTDSGSKCMLSDISQERNAAGQGITVTDCEGIFRDFVARSRRGRPPRPIKRPLKYADGYDGTDSPVVVDSSNDCQASELIAEGSVTQMTGEIVGMVDLDNEVSGLDGGEDICEGGAEGTVEEMKQESECEIKADEHSSDDSSQPLKSPSLSHLQKVAKRRGQRGHFCHFCDTSFRCVAVLFGIFGSTPSVVNAGRGRGFMTQNLFISDLLRVMFGKLFNGVVTFHCAVFIMAFYVCSQVIV